MQQLDGNSETKDYYEDIVVSGRVPVVHTMRPCSPEVYKLRGAGRESPIVDVIEEPPMLQEEEARAEAVSDRTCGVMLLHDDSQVTSAGLLRGSHYVFTAAATIALSVQGLSILIQLLRMQ